MNLNSVAMLSAFTISLTLAVERLLLYGVPTMPPDLRLFVAGVLTLAGILFGLGHRS